MLTEPAPHSDNVPLKPSMPVTKCFGTPLDERRQSSRFQRDEGTDYAIILCGSSREILAEIHDESLTGLGILVDARLELELGSHVHVVYAGEHLQGVVCHITTPSDGKCLLGLSCQRLPLQ